MDDPIPFRAKIHRNIHVLITVSPDAVTCMDAGSSRMYFAVPPSRIRLLKMTGHSTLLLNWDDKWPQGGGLCYVEISARHASRICDSIESILGQTRESA